MAPEKQRTDRTTLEFLRSMPTVGLNEAADGVDTVRAFLTRFGYLEAQEHPSVDDVRVVDDPTSSALAAYQAMHTLPVSGILDDATKEMMTRSRCALPDLDPRNPAFSVGCAWTRDSLTYAFAGGTADVAGDGERDAVRRAFGTWSASVQIAFREVGTGDNPDIRIAWTQSKCGDADMTGGVLAHSDYPPGCGFYGNALPRPLHFDDQEHAWCVGAVANQYDIETVALHEIGHILGLQHSSVAGAVMFPTTSASSTVRALAPDDIEGIRRLYPIRGPIFVKHSGRCLDVEGIATGNGAKLQQWEYWGGQNQNFRVEWVEAGRYRIIAAHSGRVADVEAIATSNGAALLQWDWWGGDNQKFRLDPVGHGYYAVVAKHSGRVLDVSGISPDNGAKVVQWDWWGGDNQKWRLGPAPIFSKKSGKALDVEAISVASGARLIQWGYWGGGNQRFRLDPVGDGWYRILVEHTGKVIDIEGISTANGAKVQQWEYWGGDNQKFRAEHTGNGYYKLIAKHSGKCLDVSNVSVADGAAIIQWEYWGGDNQQWRL